MFLHINGMGMPILSQRKAITDCPGAAVAAVESIAEIKYSRGVRGRIYHDYNVLEAHCKAIEAAMAASPIGVALLTVDMTVSNRGGAVYYYDEKRTPVEIRERLFTFK